MFLKNCTQLDSLPSEILHNIDIWNARLVHCKKLKPVLVWITQHHLFLPAYDSYELKYSPFDYYMHYDHIKYVWADRHHGPHNSVRKQVKNKLSNTSLSNVTWPFRKSHTSQRLNCILNTFYYTNLHNYTSKNLIFFICIVQNNSDIYSYWYILS